MTAQLSHHDAMQVERLQEQWVETVEHLASMTEVRHVKRCLWTVCMCNTGKMCGPVCALMDE